LQHIEMTRDVATRFHAKMGETFVMPEAKLQENAKLVPGTDGEKMSKSKGNIIDIFLSDKQLRKQIMSIQTDSTPMEAPKDWKTCNCFAIYSLLASPDAVETMRTNYEKGDYGYGTAKQTLFELIVEKFATQRERYHHYMENLNEIDAALFIGVEKAQMVADDVLKRVRSKIGY